MDEKTISEQLTAYEILQKVWRRLLLVSFLGVVAIILLKIDFQLLMVLIVIFQGSMIFVRILNLRKRYNISKGNIAIITIVGTLFAYGATRLFVYLIIIIGLITGFLAQ